MTYKERILEELRKLHAKIEMLNEILKEVENDVSDENNSNDSDVR